MNAYETDEDSRYDRVKWFVNRMALGIGTATTHIRFNACRILRDMDNSWGEIDHYGLPHIHIDRASLGTAQAPAISPIGRLAMPEQ